MTVRLTVGLAMIGAAWICAGAARGDSPFATVVIGYDPAPGQFVRDVPDAVFNDPSRALGAPVGGGTMAGCTNSVVTLGGFGGSITLAFDHTVLDEAANPFGIDCIVYGNAFWVGPGPDANRHWAECAVIEISRDVNGNGLADDPWYLIPGSHITDVAGQTQTQTWDTDFLDLTYPPAHPMWVPLGQSGTWTTEGIRLPPAIFEVGVGVVENPNGLAAEDEGIFGYADYAPTLVLGDMDADNDVDDASVTAEQFYTRPDHPIAVGITPGSGGGDGFDIAWAIDADTGQPANLAGFDFVQLTTGVNFMAGQLFELSPEIDAVADAAPGQLGDVDGNGVFDLEDYRILADCMGGPGDLVATCPCRPLDMDQDGDVDLADAAAFLGVFSGGE